jgi:hypothetical protein
MTSNETYIHAVSPSGKKLELSRARATQGETIWLDALPLSCEICGRAASEVHNGACLCERCYACETSR